MRKYWLIFVLKLAFSAVVLAIVLRFVNFKILGHSLYSARIGLILLVVSLYFPSQMFGALRWHYILKHLNNSLSYWSVFRFYMLGQFSRLFLPGQISADAVRTVAIACGRPEKGTLALSVLIDRAAFLFALFLFAFAGSIGSAMLSRFTVLIIISAVMMSASLLLLLILSRYRSERLRTWLFERAHKMSGRMAEKLAILGPDFRMTALPAFVIVMLILQGLAQQLINTIGAYLLATSVNLEIGLLDFAAINAMVALIQIIPVSIGGLGVREGSFVALFSLYGISVTNATAFSLLGFFLVAVLSTIGWLVIESIVFARKEFASRKA